MTEPTNLQAAIKAIKSCVNSKREPILAAIDEFPSMPRMPHCVRDKFIHDLIETQRTRSLQRLTNKNCVYNARSPHLKCAVHPSGSCDGCTDFEAIQSMKDDDPLDGIPVNREAVTAFKYSTISPYSMGLRELLFGRANALKSIGLNALAPIKIKLNRPLLDGELSPENIKELNAINPSRFFPEDRLSAISGNEPGINFGINKSRELVVYITLNSTVFTTFWRINDDGSEINFKESSRYKEKSIHGIRELLALLNAPIEPQTPQNPDRPQQKP
jgi:hypothetical protein